MEIFLYKCFANFLFLLGFILVYILCSLVPFHRYSYAFLFSLNIVFNDSLFMIISHLTPLHLYICIFFIPLSTFFLLMLDDLITLLTIFSEEPFIH